MFTGIIIETGTVEDLKTVSGISRLSLRTASLARDAVIGDSIAVNGVCLTVVDISGDRLAFELSGETLNSTSLGILRKGDQVNLEPSLKADGKLGGHFVTGHVDSTGRILSKKHKGETIELEIGAPVEVVGGLVDKGSVAIDGISLTVVKVCSNSFSLVIIPHTEKVTNLGDRKVGSIVNIETDIIGKYIKKFISAEREDGLISKLKDAGFMNHPDRSGSIKQRN